MTFDNLRQDLRHAVRSLLRTPAFTIITILTLALGIGANTAIFSIVNGVILRPLGYPKPEQLMYLTTQFPGMGFLKFWVSPPEYMEFREINQSFSAVGAFTTGEVNLTAGDRPMRVRSASVDEHLLNALGVPAAQGRLFASSETDITGGATGAGPAPAAFRRRSSILSHELWQSAFGGQPIVGQTVEVNGLRREVIGIMPPGTDVMDNRTEIWLPLGLNPGNRQNRGSHFLYLIGRLKDGVTPQAAQTELAALVQNWGERVGVKNHVFAPLPKTEEEKKKTGGGHILQMAPMQDEIIGAASRSIWVLQAAVGFVLLIACANLANLLLARAETRSREFAVRTALGAGRGRLLRQFMTEGVLLSIVGGALGLLLARVGVQALIRAYPTSLPRTSEVTVDPLVLLFTFGVSIATGLIFGLAPIMHTRVKGLVIALKEGGAKGATGAARHHIRRGLVMAEVALAVMLVIGAGLMLRTVYNLTTVDAGFDRVAAGDLLDGAAGRQLSAGAGARAVVSAPAREAARRRRRAGRVRHVGPAAEPAAQRQRHRHRQLHRAAGRAVRERRLLPERDEQLLRDDGDSDRAGPRLRAERRGLVRAGRRRQRNARQHVLEGPEPDRPAAASQLGARRQGAVVHRDRRGQGRQAGRHRSEDRHGDVFLRRSNGAGAAAVQHRARAR